MRVIEYDDVTAVAKEVHDLFAELDAAEKETPKDVVKISCICSRLSARQALLAEVSSRRLERQTSLLIGLTWTLVGFTAVLIILTLVLVKHG
jgi:hypothetical protein